MCSFHFPSGVSQSPAKFAPEIRAGARRARASHPGGAGSEAGCGPPPLPPGIALCLWPDPAPVVLRSHHAILYACFGGASSARSDEQPRAGVDLKCVQWEGGPIHLRCPAPNHLVLRALHCPHRGVRDMPRPAFDYCPGCSSTWSRRHREKLQPSSHPQGGQNASHTQGRVSRLQAV